jgi:glycosyltransferase involved in cell wall biosynthesis
VTPRALVVVSTYNQPSLGLCLKGYLRQTSRDFELVVADDGSKSEVGELVRRVADGPARARGLVLRHVWHEDLGFRKTRIVNQALRVSPPAPLVIFTDGDCVPPARFVERHLAAHAPRSFHVAGCVRWSKETSERLTEADVDSGAFESWITDADRRDLAIRARKSRWGTFFRRKNRPKVLGLNMAYDRALLEEANGFDERFEGWGLEDDDLRDRVMRLGPRPRVKVLYGENDVFHLWHPVRGTPQDSPNLARYRTPRPARCERGLNGAS